MQHKPQRLIFALLTVLLLLGSSGCDAVPPANPDDTLAPAPGLSATTQSPPVADAQPTARGDQPEVITFAADSLDLTSFAPLIDAFMQEYPRIIVQTVTADSFFNAPDAGTRDMRYAQAADLSLVQFERVYSVRRAQRGMWRDLSPFIAADPAFNAADFYTSTLTFGSAGDATYFVPRGVNVSFLAYNRDLWDTYRLPPPDATWTWPDVRDALARVDSLATAQPPLYGVVDDFGTGALNGEFAQAGINWATTSVDQAQLTTPARIDIFRRTAALAQDHTLYLPKMASIDDMNANVDTIDRLVQAGQVFIFSPFSVNDSTAFNVGYMPNVTIAANPGAGGGGYAISAGSQHPDAAWQLLSYLSRQDRATPGFQGVVPARRSVAEATTFWDKQNPELAAVLRAALDRPLPPLPVPNAVYDTGPILRDALQAILYQNQSPEAAVAAAQAALDQQVMAGVPPPATFAPIVVNTPIPLPAPAATNLRFAAVGLDRAALPPLIAQFQQQHPELAVQLVDARAGGLTFATVAQQSDCFAYFQPPPPAAATAVADLQPRLDADASFPRGDYPPGVLAPLQRDGRLVGLPLAIGLPALHANPTVFGDAGLPLPTAASSWADLAATAQQLTRGRGADQTLGFGIVGDLPTGVRMLLRAQGVALTTGAPPQPAFTSPAVQAALPPLVDLLRPSIPVSNTLDTLVAQGQVALWLDTRPATPGTASADSVTLLPLPALGAAAPVNVTSALFLSAQSPQPDACWTWLRFLADQPLPPGGDGYPARVSQAQADAFTQQAPAGATDVYAAALPAVQQPARPQDAAPDVFADDPRAATWFDRAVVQALQGADITRALDAAQTTTEAYLACVQGGTDGPACARQVDPTYQEPGVGP